MDWSAAIAASIQQRTEEHSLRRRRSVKVLDATHVEVDGASNADPPLLLTNFASNNYLGLTHHPRVVQAFETAVKAYGVGSGAAALVTGQTRAHTAAERAIAAWKGTESAVLTSSGYTANLAAVQALAAIGRQTGVRFLIDKLAHASLIDAVKNTGSFRVFPHNHLDKLRRLLSESDPAQLQVVVTESVFSMDGDVADLPGIIAIKREFPFLLLLDEAHASGVYGPNGAGFASELGLQNEVDLTVVTLSKALGCSGGAICGSGSLVETVVNFGRPYIFSTSVPPAVAAAAAAAIDVLSTEPERQHRLRAMSIDVRARLRRAGHRLPTGDSPIIPIIYGGESETLEAAARLQSRGLLAVAVRPPTVARGSSRLRITLSSEHTDAEVNQLIDSLV